MLQWHVGLWGGVSGPAQRGSPHCLMNMVSTGCHGPGSVTSFCPGARLSLLPDCGNEMVSLCKDGFPRRGAGPASGPRSGCQEPGWREAQEGIPGRVLALAHSWHPRGPSNVVHQCPVAGSCWQTRLSCCPPLRLLVTARKLCRRVHKGRMLVWTWLFCPMSP